jgi:hypothetical protein
LSEDLPSHWWEVDDSLPRIASCSLNIEDPMNPSAIPTHLIFVDPEDLQNAIDSIQPADRVNLIPELDGAAVRPDVYLVSTLEVTAWLKGLMGNPACHSWTRGRFRRDAEEKFGSRAGGEVFKRAWKQAVDSYPRFSKPGVRGDT